MYPLKFHPIIKDKIWGGHKLEAYGKDAHGLPNIGESWELSAHDEDVSVVSNGFLQENTLNELVEVYMGDLVGERIYQRYGNQFPLLFKFIDAGADLSVQVHPNDEVALERHGSLGKSEMWYVLDAEDTGSLILGFKEDTDANGLLEHLEEHRLEDLLQVVPVQKGDVAYLPSGLVHSLGKGVMVAEIQETSDLTYRIYDYERTDAQGNQRELHIQEALDVIDYKATKKPLIDYYAALNTSTNLTQDVFIVNLLHFDRAIIRDYTPLDSFVVYMCVEGTCQIETDGHTTSLTQGETVLIPATIGEVTIIPTTPETKLLETYM